jgi:hypothetical protein
MGQDQGVKVALGDAHRTIGILMGGEYGFEARAQGELGPAVAAVADAPKARFILKHYLQRA